MRENETDREAPAATAASSSSGCSGSSFSLCPNQSANAALRGRQTGLQLIRRVSLFSLLAIALSFVVQEQLTRLSNTISRACSFSVC